jgi:hypothetical protein
VEPGGANRAGPAPRGSLPPAARRPVSQAVPGRSRSPSALSGHPGRPGPLSLAVRALSGHPGRPGPPSLAVRAVRSARPARAALPRRPRCPVSHAGLGRFPSPFARCPVSQAGQGPRGLEGRPRAAWVAGRAVEGQAEAASTQRRIHVRPAGARLRNPLYISFKGSSPSGLWAVWATRSVVQVAGGRPSTFPDQSLSTDAAPSTARIAGRQITDDPGQDPFAGGK